MKNFQKSEEISKNLEFGLKFSGYDLVPKSWEFEKIDVLRRKKWDGLNDDDQKMTEKRQRNNDASLLIFFAPMICLPG